MTDPGVTDTTPHQRGRRFEIDVADVYRALGFKAERNVTLRGQQVDVLVRGESPGGLPIVLLVECKASARPVANSVVQDFLVTVDALRNDDAVTGGVMVSTSGFSPQAKAATGSRSYVRLASWHDLTDELFNVRRAAREHVEDYESREIFRDYLPLRADRETWDDSKDGMTLTETPSVDDALLASVANTEPGTSPPSLYFVIADYGAGKTTLLERLHYALAQRWLADDGQALLPVYVPLREYETHLSVMALIRSSFREQYGFTPTDSMLHERLASGRLCILLDGFDEMVSRSDAERRLLLLSELLPLIKAPAPLILSSRPSYFVEKQEFESLLLTLRGRELDLRARPRLYARTMPNLALLEAIRGDLLKRTRGRIPDIETFSDFPAGSVEVFRLCPLDRDQISAYLEARRTELAERAHATPDQVLSFIDRTYDLGDLVTRPILLHLVTQTVLGGLIDLGDVTLRLGPSGLYEIYTTVKLDLELDKGEVRSHGLTSDQRLSFAESVAIKMFESGVREVDLADVFADVIGEASTSSELSFDEALTDFSTASFVTLNDNGLCRFVHKSFSDFFVARVLKRTLSSKPQLLQQRLPHEVLYFLGGFSPTEPQVRDVLWTQYTKAVEGDVLSSQAASNLAAAFLYTQQVHKSHGTLHDVDLQDARYGSLEFRDSRLRDVTFEGVTIRELTLEEFDWRRLELERTVIDKLLMRKGFLKAGADRSRLHECEASHCSVELTSDEATIEAATFEGCSTAIHGTCAMQNVEVLGGSIQLAGSSGVEDSGEGELQVERLATRHAVVRLGRRVRTGSATFVSSAVALGSLRPLSSVNESSMDSIFVLDERWPWPEALDLECGVFGCGLRRIAKSDSRPPRAQKSGTRQVALREIRELAGSLPEKGWGVAVLTNEAASLILSDTLGFACGPYLLVPECWYQRATEEGGPLTGVGDLRKAAESPPRRIKPSDGSFPLAAMLANRIREQFDALRSDLASSADSSKMGLPDSQERFEPIGQPLR